MNALRGKIISCFGSLLKFSEAVGWSSRKVYDIVNGKQQLTARDIETMCGVLKVQIPEEMMMLFFTM